MPIYEYHCTACDRKYDFFFKSYPTKQQLSLLKCETADCPGPLEKKISECSVSTGSAQSQDICGHANIVPVLFIRYCGSGRQDQRPSPVKPLGAHELN